jgi:hypothetical protein
MKIRIIKKPEFMSLHHLQKKTRWLPFWRTVETGTLQECQYMADNLVKHGKPYTVVYEGETK